MRGQSRAKRSQETPSANQDPDHAIEALTTVFRSIESQLWARALRLEQSPHRARDLVQDTFERGLRRRHLFQRGTSMQRWLSRIMYNIFLARCRRQGRMVTVAGYNLDRVAAPEPEPPELWKAVDPEDLEDALAQLEPQFRTVADLHWRQSLSYREIGDRLGISIQTVGSRLHRARQRLRSSLGARVQRGDAAREGHGRGSGSVT